MEFCMIVRNGNGESLHIYIDAWDFLLSYMKEFFSWFERKRDNAYSLEVYLFDITSITWNDICAYHMYISTYLSIYVYTHTQTHANVK